MAIIGNIPYFQTNPNKNNSSTTVVFSVVTTVRQRLAVPPCESQRPDFCCIQASPSFGSSLGVSFQTFIFLKETSGSEWELLKEPMKTKQNHNET